MNFANFKIVYFVYKISAMELLLLEFEGDGQQA